MLESFITAFIIYFVLAPHLWVSGDHHKLLE